MTSIRETLRQLFTPTHPLTPGIYHYQAPPDAQVPYRLHLRLEPNGQGILIVNASTILHLNQTAAEYAYHLVRQTAEPEMASSMVKRYRVNRSQALNDFQDFRDRIDTLILSPDLDPVMFLSFDRSAPYEQITTAPYRLDCAITYQLPDHSNAEHAPVKRVERELTSEEWFTIIDKAWNVGIPHIIFTGGEPTLRGDLTELIAHAEANGQVTGLLTDGLLLANPAYLDSLLQTGLDHILILLDPDNVKSWQSIENAVAADIFVAVHLSVNLHNAMDASDTIHRLSSKGVKALSLSINDASLHNKLVELRDLAADLELSLVWDLPVPYSAFNPIAIEIQEDEPVTGSGRAWLYVEPDGDVLPAQGINQVLGNFLTDPWDKLWQ